MQCKDLVFGLITGNGKSVIVQKILIRKFKILLLG